LSITDTGTTGSKAVLGANYYNESRQSVLELGPYFKS